ncbi:histidine ammonia-lyase [Leptolyngbya sp. FACHB-261]|uniref:histidine ammonia-lyase n=1 Tax=Leptolyngbya sp. FACHB-261 TaxID=2692806 RepID=UPI00168A3AC3|nr:histidine ammonia-lyase [Leptolyngbya sp. FACHB-261]MBD2104563.1 histidine ammonia-lyase [Leptolyngbya sp. FACHB-261]
MLSQQPIPGQTPSQILDQSNSFAASAEVFVGKPLTLKEVVLVARGGARVSLAPEAQTRVLKSRTYVEDLVAQGQTIYGLTTGFGKLANIRIAPADTRQLQRNLILSHAIGLGQALPRDVVRAMLLLRAQSLALGFSGIRLQVIELLLECLNRGVHPVIPSQGSVGASGDLAPLAHMSLPLIGEGQAEYAGQVMPSSEALAQAGLQAVVLEAKEGLALINGTQAMTAIGALVVADALELATAADITGAMSLEALKGSLRPFDARVTAVRPHPGAAEVAENVRGLGANSPIHHSHADCDKLQDAYSLRCMPQVHGASRDALRHVLDVVTREINAVTDNPLIFCEDNEVISAGNFHGQPVALVMDYAKIAIAELANISERRIEHMLDPALSGLPAFLSQQGGLNSGLMISQYTAASLVSENKVLAHPASVDSIPTSANQEDHVSMGTTSARQAAMILENARWVIAIELVNATQALDFHQPLHPGPGVMAAVEAVRRVVPHLDRDRSMTGDLEAARGLIISGELRQAVEAAVGTLH